MKASLLSEGFHQYLVFEANIIDMKRYEIKMLMHYRGTGLLPVEFQLQDGKGRIRYEISGGISLQQQFDHGEMDGKMLRTLFLSILSCYTEMEEYLLPAEGMIFQPDKIIYLPEKRAFQFCYYPNESGVFQKDFLELTEFCMKHIPYQNSEAVLFIYGLYRKLQNGTMEEEEIKHYLEEGVKSEKEDAYENHPDDRRIVKQQVVQNQEIKGEKWDYIEVAGDNQEQKTRKIQWYIYGSLALVAFVLDVIFGIRFLGITHGETDLKCCIILTVLVIFLLYCMFYSRGKTEKKQVEKKEFEIIADAKPSQMIEETMILNTDIPFEEWELMDLRDNQVRIQLNQLPGILGRKAGEVDYLLSDEGISRRHLKLYIREDSLYVEDLGSTNGTYVNGIRLEVGEAVMVSDEDLLAIGPCKFKVKKKVG